MSTSRTHIKCQAKDPTTCRYHGTQSGSQQFQILVNAQKTELAVGTEYRDLLRKHAQNNTNADNDPYVQNTARKYFEAKKNVENAEDAYNATTEGLLILQNQLDRTTDGLAWNIIKLKQDRAKIVLKEHEASLAKENNKEPAHEPLAPEEYVYVPPTLETKDITYWPVTTGSNYDPELRGPQLKARINAELKKAQKEGYLPRSAKFSLTSRRNSIHCEIRNLPDVSVSIEPEDIYHSRLTPEATELKNRVSLIVNSFNNYQYDEIEGRRNRTHFWDFVGFESPWARTQRFDEEQKKAKRKAEKVSE